MKKQLLASKLCMPKIVCNQIKRGELLKRIYEMPEQVTVLHAGMGYGKTTIMADYFKTYGLPCGWYQLGRADDDMNRFLYYFEVLLQKQVAQFCIHKETTVWSREMTELVVIQILEQLQLWDGVLNIVLDDFQFLHNPIIYEFLSLFFQYMGDGIRVFLLLRGKIPGFLTRLVLQGKVGVLGVQDLKVTEAELKKCLWKRGMEGKEAALNQILDCTEGWAVAVNYVLEHQSEIDWSREKIADFLCTSDLAEYLFYEISNSLSANQQIFMMESAVLTRLTPEACDYILETDEAGEFLEAFVNRQLLTERVGQREYRYHPILRNLLYKQTKERRKQEIRKRAEQYFGTGVTLIKEKAEPGDLLQLTCFGGIQIHIGDEKNMVHWRTRKTKEMFAYFWEQEERPVSKERIMDVLWEEGDEQRREALFHTTLSYLKRGFSIIGISDLIQMDNKRYTMKRHCFHSDTQGLKRLHEVWKKDMGEMDVEREFGELSRIYRGDYMEDLDGSWVIAGREYYQGIYLQCCELLVNRADKNQKYDFIIHVLEQALKLDPYSDKFNGMLLKNLCDMGKFQAAKQQYEKYNRLLKEELNIETGKQVQEVYRNRIIRCCG